MNSQHLVELMDMWQVAGKATVRPGGQRGALDEHVFPVGGPVVPQDPQPIAALLLQVAGGAEEELKAGQVGPGGQGGVLHEHTLPVGGPVGPQDPQPTTALLLQRAGGAEEELEGVEGEQGQHSRPGEPVLLHKGGKAGVGRHGCPQYGVEESEDSLQGGVDREDRQLPAWQLTLTTGLSRGIQEGALTR